MSQFTARRLAALASLFSTVAALSACGGGTSDSVDAALAQADARKKEPASMPSQAPAPADAAAADPTTATTAAAAPVQPANSADPAAPAPAATPATSSPAPAPTSSSPAPAAPASPVPPPAPGTAWTDPTTWGGVLPTAGAEVVIPAGKTVVLDTATPALAGLRIEGTLRVTSGVVALNAAFIDLKGALLIGDPSAPFTGKATITLNGARPATTNDGVSRGLVVRGGRLELYGVAPQPAWTKLGDNAAAGATNLSLMASTNWKAGDTVVIAPTDFYGQSSTERIALSGASGSQVNLSSALAKARWGKLQYMTPTGLSLAPSSAYTPPVAPAPTVLDERAPIGNLSRNIVIQGADDAAWQTYGFGAHLMIMDLRSKVVVDSVEFRRVGQAGATGRYPFHWHMLSYGTDGSLLGDATGHELRNSTIWNSANRCVVIHATNGVVVKNNICQDIKGHAFFLEDAVERRNLLDGNLALTTRIPPGTTKLQVHEGDIFQGGPSGFWLTNPDNTVRNNVAGDTTGNGFWMAFPTKTLGLSTAVALVPSRMKHGGFDNNTAFSARGPGILMDWVPTDAAGNVINNMYIPTSGPTDSPPNTPIGFKATGNVSFKNRDGAYRNRAYEPHYIQWTTADNVGTHFAGSVTNGEIAQALVIGQSLNVGAGYPDPVTVPSGFATYNSSMHMHDNTIVGMHFAEGKISGAFKTDDYYLHGVQKGTIRNPGNALIDSDPGYRSLPPHLEPGFDPTKDMRHWSLSGALWDPYGYWGPKGQWSVFDVPFLTAGANCVWMLPAGKNGKSCDGQYYGVEAFATDFDTNFYDFRSPVTAVRQDANGAEIGRWEVADGTTSTMLYNMRHFAARTGGRYVLSFPNRPLPKYVSMGINNAYRAGDTFLLAVPFDGTRNASGYLSTCCGRNDPQAWSGTEPYAKYARYFTPTTSIDNVAASAGNLMYQDRANNVVWIKFQGGMPFPNESTLEQNSDIDLYRPYTLVIYAK